MSFKLIIQNSRSLPKIIGLLIINFFLSTMIIAQTSIEELENKKIGSFEKEKINLKLRVVEGDFVGDSLMKKLLAKPLFGNLTAVVVLDDTNAVRFLFTEDVQHWNLASDLIYETAAKNTKTFLEDVVFTAMTGENSDFHVVYDEPNYFINSIILFPELFLKIDKKNSGLLVGIPARSLFSIMPLQVANGADCLREFQSFLAQAYTNEENPTTLDMFFFKNGTVEVISPIYDEEGYFVNFLMPAKLQGYFK